MAYFDELMRDMKLFQRSLVERMIGDMKTLDEAVRRGDLKGRFEVREIDQPDTKGFVAYGHFQSEKPVRPLDPHRPDWFPERPIKPPLGESPNEVREPLTDVFEDERSVKLIVELPGAKKDDVQLNVSDGQAEVKAKNFYKVVKLPTDNLNPDKIDATCRNGVLEVTIPKKKAVKGGRKRKIKIE